LFFTHTGTEAGNSLALLHLIMKKDKPAIKMSFTITNFI